MNKNEMIAYMKANPTCYLATVEGNAPRVRAVGVYKIAEDEIIIQTNVTKDLNKQMLQNPNIEMLFFDKKNNAFQLRVRGTVEPLKDEAMLKKVVEDRPFLKDAIAKGSGPALFRVKKPQAYCWSPENNFAPKSLISIY
jgi:pyridoxamine 5'-phosphate oxidase